MGFSRFAMVYVQPHALPWSAPAGHAGLRPIFEQDLVPDLGPLIRIQKLPAGLVWAT